MASGFYGFFKKIMFRLLKAHYHKPLLVFALPALWQLGVMLFQVKEYIIPSPLSVLARIFVPAAAGKYGWREASRPYKWNHCMVRPSLFSAGLG
jgi:ABC-type nitrate/sulfonate/bicarbonate transport system permease component